jgi:heptosyltransferase-1
MGDIIHGLPTLATLKANFPDWEVDWLVEHRWRELLEDNPLLTCVMEFDTLRWRRSPLSVAAWGELRTAAEMLRARRYDYALDLQGAIKSAVACSLSGAWQVVGLERPWLREPFAGVFYTHRVSSHAEHVVEAGLALAAALGASRAVTEFPLPAGDEAALPAALRHGAFAVLNPGAGWAAKQWPAANYAEVCDELDARYALPAVLNCGPGEMELSEAVCSACRRAPPLTYCGGLAGLIALLRRARLMIGSDSGPVHLAAALGVPTVALFGPTDPRRNRPYGSAHRNLRPAGVRTSHRRSGRGSGEMERIPPAQVFEAIGELLQVRGQDIARSSCAAS